MANSKVSESFLRFVNYHREQIQDYANLTKDLYRLTGSKTVFDWQEHHQSAFELMKDKLLTAPILSYLNAIFYLKQTTTVLHGYYVSSIWKDSSHVGSRS